MTVRLLTAHCSLLTAHCSGIPADSASSLRALVDSKLRAQVIAANAFNPSLGKERANLDGTGHNFYVDDPAKQTDLINFLLALDDNPGQF